MREVSFIKQRADWDCGVCCLAMVSGILYDDIMEDFRKHSIEGEGIVGTLFDWWFIQRGFATQVIHEEPPDGWKPWAPVHIAFVRATQGGHVCVVDHAGRVFDPFDIRRRTLTHKDYRTVRGLIGIWDINSIKAEAA